MEGHLWGRRLLRGFVGVASDVRMGARSRIDARETWAALRAAPTIRTTPTGFAYVVPRAVEDLDQRAATLLGRGVGVKCHSNQGGMAQPNCSRAATSETNEVWQTDELHFA